MKIFSADQIRKWDAYTIQHESLSSVDLMERAATACVKWIVKNFDNNSSFKVFCGKGNNGGDGLAIARLLIQNKFPTTVYIVGDTSAGSDDFQTNLNRLQPIAEIQFLDSAKSFPALQKNDVLIDAIFGTGLNKKPSGIYQIKKPAGF